MKKISVLLAFAFLMVALTSSNYAFAQGCQIPPTGPWPPCASNGGGGNNWNPAPTNNNPWNPAPPSGGDCVIPPTGPWPPCASNGGGSSAPSNNNPWNPAPTNTGGGCTIPPSGPWPPCASNGGGTPGPAAPAPTNTGGNDGGCTIPPSGPWPPCASNGGGTSAPAPTTPNNNNQWNPAPANTGPGNLPQGFLMGGQTHTFANPDKMKSSGMNWVKIQHKWTEGETGEVVRERINRVHSQGMKVLLSIPGIHANSINYGAYVQFLGQVSAEGPDAIEVWSEPNIEREWPAGQISATSYVNNMLKPAYQKIKSVNNNILVISGGPAPTGFFGGGCAANGCDDKPYIEEMFRAGAGDALDCVGIHYNEGILPPSARSGDPRGNSSHYTRYYPTMVETYRAAIGDKPLCFTEFGYLSFDGFDEVPAGFSWAKDTSEQEQADWLGQAVTLTKNDPGVMMMIVFNVDITTFTADPQAGFAMLRPNNTCPSCWTIKSAMGR